MADYRIFVDIFDLIAFRPYSPTPLYGNL